MSGAEIGTVVGSDVILASESERIGGANDDSVGSLFNTKKWVQWWQWRL